MILVAHLFASQHCHSTFTWHIKSNLTSYTVSYKTYVTHKVVYCIPLFALYEDTALSFDLC